MYNNAFESSQRFLYQDLDLLEAFRNEHPELPAATTFDLEEAVCRLDVDAVLGCTKKGRKFETFMLPLRIGCGFSLVLYIQRFLTQHHLYIISLFTLCNMYKCIYIYMYMYTYVYIFIYIHAVF